MTLRAYTTDELNLLRSDRQWSKLYLTVFKPATIYTARVNGVPASNDKVASIEYDGGSGTLANVKPGMTIRIGSAAGLRDRGEERIRKTPDADTSFFEETSEIQWVDNDFITIVDDFQLRAKHLRISGGAALVDYDIAYSDQHTAFDPVPVMGSHRIAWKSGSSVAITVPQIASSWVIGSTISSRSTTCAGATVTNGTTSNPTITFNTPGRYVIYTTVTAANGKSFTGVRCVYVHDETDMPYTDFELLDLSGSYDDGGFSARIRLFTEAADVDTFEEGALCILHCVDYYDGEPQTIEMETGTGNILFIGRITNESITINREQATVEFDLEGFQERGKRTDQVVNLSGVVVDESGRGSALFSMAQGHVSQNYFPYGVELAKNTPTAWTQMPALTVKRALFDLLHWYSTATAIMDVFIEDDDRLASELSAAGETLWEKINELAYLSIFASPGVDPYGRLWIEIEPQLVSEADRDAVEIMEIARADWTGKIDIVRTPTQRGAPEIIDRLLLTSQAQSNQLAGLYYGWKHNELGPIRIDFASIVRGFTLFPRQKAFIQIAAADNVRGIERAMDIIPREISYRHDAQSGTLLPSIQFEAETFEALSINGDIPGSEGDDISIPPLPPLPPLPPPPPLIPGDISSTPDGPPLVVLLDDTKGLLYSQNFNASGADVIWQFCNAGIDAADVPNIADIRITPSGSVWVIVPPYNIYFAPAIGAIFAKVIDFNWLQAQYPNPQFDSASGGGRFIAGFAINHNKPEEIALIAGGNNFGPFVADINFWIGNHNGVTKKAACTNVNGFFGSMSYGYNKWVLLNEQYTFIGFWDSRLWRFSADGATLEYQVGIDSGGAALIQQHIRASTTARFYFWNVFGNKFYESPDNGTTITLIGDNKQSGNSVGSYACDPTGQYVLGVWDTGLRGKSSDYGATWSGLPNLPVGGAYCFAYAGGAGTASRWIAARGVVQYSNNAFGAENWQNKEGNINYLIPVGLTIQKIIVPGVVNGN